MDWKLDLYTKVAPASSRRTRSSRPIPPACRSPSSSDVLPEEIKPRFCGIHFFNPPRYMSAGRAHPDPGDAPRDVLDQLESVRHDGARQGRRAREGHPELRRQSRRHRRHARHDHRGGEVRPELRPRRRPHRQEAGPREFERHVPHRGRRRPRHHGATSSGRCRTISPTTRSTQSYATPAVARPPDRAGRARLRRAVPASTRRPARRSSASTPPRGDLCRRAARKADRAGRRAS